MNELVAFVIGLWIGAVLALTVIMVADWRDGRRPRRGR